MSILDDACEQLLSIIDGCRLRCFISPTDQNRQVSETVADK